MTAGEQQIVGTISGEQTSPEAEHRATATVSPGVNLIWWLLAAWAVGILFASLAYIVWVVPLGFGGIVYIVFGTPVVMAGFAFGIAWMCLGHDSRLARFADLPMGMAALTIVVARSLQDDFSACWPIFQFLVVVSLPLVLLRQRGFYISTLSSNEIATAWWRFGIADLLVMTTCLAVLLGLVSLSDQPVSEVGLLLGFALPTWLAATFGLSSRIVFRAYSVSSLLLVLFGAFLWIGNSLLGEWLPEFLGLDVQIAVLVGAVQSIALMVVVVLLRWQGFRLRSVGTAGLKPAAQTASIR